MIDNKYSKLFEEADASFNGIYKKEIVALHGISNEEIEAISGNKHEDGFRMYSILIKVVEQASRDNLAQAKLGKHIKELGSLASNIAMKVPQLAALVS